MDSWEVTISVLASLGVIVLFVYGVYSFGFSVSSGFMSWFSAWCGGDFRVYGVGAHVG